MRLKFFSTIKGVAISLVAAIALSSCSSLLYFPTRIQYYDPKRTGIDYEVVHFNSVDGTRLMGWYFPHRAKNLKKPKGVFLFFHGNAENLTSHFSSLLWILDEGYEYLIFDYRGYGGSEGIPTPKGTVMDGIAALRYLKNRTDPEVPMFVFAQSLGGAIALRSLVEVKNEVPIRWVVLDSTFVSYPWAGASVLSQHWFTTWLQPFAFLTLSDEWSAKDRVKELSPIPILVMHGTKDQAIDFRLGERLYAEAAEPKEFYRIEGGRHIDSFWAHDGRVKKDFLERAERVVREKWWAKAQ